MLDINTIRNNPDKVKEGIQKKGVDPKWVEKFIKFDTAWRGKKKNLDDLRADQNEISEKISKEKNEDLINKAQVLKKQVHKLEKETDELKEKRNKALSEIPNIPFEEALEGEDEEDNEVLKKVGEKPDFDFNPKDHMELGENLDLIDTHKASEVSGSRFRYLKNEAVLLEFGLVQLAFEVLLDKGFKPINPPVMIRPEIMKKMGKVQFLKKNDAFSISEDNLKMVGSSEQSIGPINLSETKDKKDLPQRFIGFSSCFRREAGSYGKDTRGIIRVHQFDKLEMLSFTSQKKSREEHEFLLEIQEKLMQKLNLPYRVVEICTGDMTWADARQFDLETWIPTQEKYRETHSCSNTTDFQSRGIEAKYSEGNEKRLMHMLNGTAYAIERTLVAIMENFQTSEGEIKIPKALQKYVGKKKISKE